jgi:hypothetical protein
VDAVLDADPNAKLFAIVAINYGDRFTSPLNLPGPNRHEAKDGPNLTKALVQSLSHNPDVFGSLIIPICFDNERVCEPFVGAADEELMQQRDFEATILSALQLRV